MYRRVALPMSRTRIAELAYREDRPFETLIPEEINATEHETNDRQREGGDFVPNVSKWGTRKLGYDG
jgi:hypothetical protein